MWTNLPLNHHDGDDGDEKVPKSDEKVPKSTKVPKRTKILYTKKYQQIPKFTNKFQKEVPN